MPISKDKKAALASLMKGINKKFGDETVNFVSDMKDKLAINFLKSPSHEFNMMLYGGLGIGKIIEFFGPESSGKTTMAIEIIKKQQEENKEFIAGWFETEGSMSKDQLENFGIDMDRLIYWDQKELSAEKGLDVLRSIVESDMVDMIVVNSVAGLVPETEVENDLTHQNIGVIAKIMSKLFRVITGIADKTKTTLLFINQIREKVGVMFGNPETTTGGRALQFYASQRIRFSRVKLQSGDGIKDEEGLKIHCKVYKNRFALGNPYKVCDYIAEYGKGINNIMEIPTILERENLIVKSGAWYYYPSKTNIKTIDNIPCKFNGKASLIKALTESDELRKFFEELISEEYSNSKAGEHLDANEIKKIKDEEQDLEKAFENNDEDNEAIN